MVGYVTDWQSFPVRVHVVKILVFVNYMLQLLNCVVVVQKHPHTLHKLMVMAVFQ